jgi:hypothetical protein
MRPVRADQQVDGLAGPVAELHTDTGRVLADDLDGGIEPDRHLVGDLLAQHGLEVAAEEVEVAAGEQPAAEGRVGQAEAPSAFLVEEDQLGDGAVDRLQPWQQVHPLGGVVAGPEEVDHVASPRGPAASSTTSGSQPSRRRPSATVSPAMPAPTISARLATAASSTECCEQLRRKVPRDIAPSVGSIPMAGSRPTELGGRADSGR